MDELNKAIQQLEDSRLFMNICTDSVNDIAEALGGKRIAKPLCDISAAQMYLTYLAIRKVLSVKS
jgi:hypothetical protein